MDSYSLIISKFVILSMQYLLFLPKITYEKWLFWLETIQFLILECTRPGFTGMTEKFTRFPINPSSTTSLYPKPPTEVLFRAADESWP